MKTGAEEAAGCEDGMANRLVKKSIDGGAAEK